MAIDHDQLFPILLFALTLLSKMMVSIYNSRAHSDIGMGVKRINTEIS